MTSYSVHSTKKTLADIVHNEVTAWVVLALSLLVTAFAWQISTVYVERRAVERFQFEVEDAKISIAKRMQEYEQTLLGGVALFNATGQPVTRQQWHTFVSTLNIEKYFPGLQGIGFSRWVLPQDKDDVIAQVRAEGYPEFTIKPEGERAFYTSIVYLEPMDARNLRAFGYDMFSEPTRRAAMEHARDTGQASVSGRVVLLQETKQDVQAGFLMYLPVYHAGTPVTTVEQRRTAILGFVYSPFRMKDLMLGILGGTPGLDFKLYDGNQVEPDALLFDTFKAWGSDQQDHAQQAVYTNKSAIDLPGRTWTAVFTSRRNFEAEMSSNQPQLIAVGGATVDMMLFAVIWSLSQQRKRVVAKAREMTAELRRSREQFRAITDTANDAIISTDVNGRILYCNPAAVTIFEIAAEKLVGLAVAELLSPDPGASQKTSPTTLMERGRLEPVSATIEAIGVRANKTEFPLEVSISNWTVDDKAYFTLLMRDITERKRVDKLKSEFVSTVSHELRTPLTAIRGALGLLNASNKNTESTPQNTSLIEIAYKNTERLVRLVNDILDLEKLESGRMVLDIQPVDLADLLKQAVQENQHYAIPHGVSLVLDEPLPDISLQADAGRLMQVLANLLSNAIKFSPQDATVMLGASVRSGRVHVSVTDTGIGIPEEFRSSLFQRFTQADATDTRQKGGSGLGLSISKSIIELHHGTIGYESEVDKGACFYFDLDIDIDSIEKQQPVSI